MPTAGEPVELAEYIQFPEKVCARSDASKLSYLLEDGKLRVVSPLFATLLAYASEELVGVDLLSLIHPGDRTAAKRICNEAEAIADCPITRQFRFLTRNGTILWLLNTLKRIDWQSQLFVLGECSDVTLCRKASEALANSGEHYYKAFLRSTYDFACICTLEDGRYVELNRTMAQLFGKSPEQIIGQSTIEVGYWVNPSDRDKFVAALNKSGKISNYEVRYRNVVRGQKCTGLCQAELINLGGVQCVISITLDITMRKHAEEALQESDRFNTALLRGSPHPILVINPDTSIKYANPALENLTGFACVELIGNRAPYPWSFSEDPDNDYLLESETYSGRVSLEKPLQNRQGDTKWVEISSEAVTVGDDVKYYVENWVDVTERRRLLENLKSYSNAVTNILEEERKRIVRDLHDETTQDLASLFVDIENILSGREHLPQSAILALERLLGKIERICDQVRSLSHELRPEILTDFGLIPSIQVLADDLNSEKIATCTLEITGDERRLPNDVELVLFRVAQETLRNAKKHARAKKIQIRLDFQAEETQLTVSDDGIGFELPTSLSNLVRQSKFGLIGMSERVRLRGGFFLVDSAVGKGTTILARVPA
jgi:PAS domain S-box-containing protein